MPVSFDKINAREYRHRCFIFDQIRDLAKSKQGGKIKGLKKAVDGGYSKIVNPPASDPTLVFPIAFRMDTNGASAKVRYTTLFSFNAGFYLFQADPVASKKSTGFAIVTCVKLTAQQFANFVASFARDAGERFGFQDAQMNSVATAGQNGPAPNNDQEFYANTGEQMMPAVIPPSNYDRTSQTVGGQIGFLSTYSTRIPAPAPPSTTSFVQAIGQVAAQAEEIYQ